jgi:hypothetical protein
VRAGIWHLPDRIAWRSNPPNRCWGQEMMQEMQSPPLKGITVLDVSHILRPQTPNDCC